MSEIKIEGLSKSIKGALILDNISLVLDSGNIYGLRGKNGSGKTMLMRAIAGLLIPDSGTVTINGKVLHLDGDKTYAQRSLRYYKKLGINAVVKSIAESKQPEYICSLITRYKLDILVITRT